MKRIFLATLFSIVLVPNAAWAQLTDEEQEASLLEKVERLSSRVEHLNDTVRTQQSRINVLEAERDGRDQAAQLVPAESGAVKPSRTARMSGLQGFNPEIGVVADIVAQASESSLDEEGNDRIAAREVELVFGHPIDPYSRMDVTVALSDFEEASLEEAYVTHWGLPAEINGRIGRFKPKLGKAIVLHRDSLDTVDEPLVVAQYFGVEGLARAGVDFTGFLPLPWNAVTHELSAGFLEGGVGEGGSLLGETRRRPTYYAHLKNFWDVSDMTSAELGATCITGSKDDDSDLEVQALGLDSTLIHHLSAHSRLKWQNEIYLQDRDESFSVAVDEGTGDEIVTLFDEHPWGGYTLLDYRINPKFAIGGRFDWVQPVDLDAAAAARDEDTAWNGYLTFYQSEFARWRLQYRHTNFALGGSDDTLFVQGTMAIGVHKHALQ